MAELQNWFNGLPPVTKWFFTISVSTTLLTHFGVFNATRLVLAFRPIYEEFQIWRLFSPFFLHFLGLPFLMSMVFLLRYGQALERNHFAGRSSDFLTMLLSTGLILLIPAYFFKIPILSNAIIMVLIYYWARVNPDLTVTFMFGISFKSRYLPWAMVAFTTLLGGNPLVELIGIVVGHVYYLLVDRIPVDYGYTLIKTPGFIKDLFPNEVPLGVPPMQAAQQEPAGFRGARYGWGSGQRLGSS